jgi:hypothetical protein
MAGRGMDTRRRDLGEPDTGDYLRGLGDWVSSAHFAYANHGEVMPDPPDWRFIAHALTVATVYE